MQSPCDPFFGFPPGQEPEVMPGFLAPITQRQEGAPASEASPWPPLSRQQVVELHEALSRWLRDIQSADNATDWASHVWSANDALRTSLLDMGIQPAEAPTFQTKWAMLEAVLAEREAKVAGGRTATEGALGRFACLDSAPHPHSERPPEGLFKMSDIKIDPTLPRGTMLMTSPKGVSVLVNVGEEPTATLASSPLGVVKHNCPGWEPKP